MKYQYTLTVADYYAAIWLYARQKWTRRVGHLSMYWLLPICGLITLTGELYFVLRGQLSFADNQSWMLAAPVPLLVLPLAQWNLVRKQFKLMFPSENRTLTIDIDNERILVVNPGTSETRFTWNGILSFTHDEKIALLFVAKGRFLFFPTQGLSTEQRIELLELTSRHLPRN